MATPRPYRWNEAAAQYVGPNGRFVSRIAVRDAIDKALDTSAKRMAEATQKFRERKMTAAQFRLVMRREIKNVHLYSGAAARGGWAQLTQAELGRIGQIVGREYAYLDRYIADVRSGKMARDGRMLSRSKLYAQAGRKTYHVTDERVNLAKGMKEERNVPETNPCPQCVEQTSLGWVKIGRLVPIGNRQCLSNCRCYIQYR